MRLKNCRVRKWSLDLCVRNPLFFKYRDEIEGLATAKLGMLLSSKPNSMIVYADNLGYKKKNG